MFYSVDSDDESFSFESSKEHFSEEEEWKSVDLAKQRASYGRSFQERGFRDKGHHNGPQQADERARVARRARQETGSKKDRRYLAEFAGRGKSKRKSQPRVQQKRVTIPGQPQRSYQDPEVEDDAGRIEAALMQSGDVEPHPGMRRQRGKETSRPRATPEQTSAIEILRARSAPTAAERVLMERYNVAVKAPLRAPETKTSDVELMGCKDLKEKGKERESAPDSEEDAPPALPSCPVPPKLPVTAKKNPVPAPGLETIACLTEMARFQHDSTPNPSLVDARAPRLGGDAMRIADGPHPTHEQVQSALSEFLGLEDVEIDSIKYMTQDFEEDQRLPNLLNVPRLEERVVLGLVKYHVTRATPSFYQMLFGSDPDQEKPSWSDWWNEVPDNEYNKFRFSPSLVAEALAGCSVQANAETVRANLRAKINSVPSLDIHARDAIELYAGSQVVALGIAPAQLNCIPSAQHAGPCGTRWCRQGSVYAVTSSRTSPLASDLKMSDCPDQSRAERLKRRNLRKKSKRGAQLLVILGALTLGVYLGMLLLARTELTQTSYEEQWVSDSTLLYQTPPMRFSASSAAMLFIGCGSMYVLFVRWILKIISRKRATTKPGRTSYEQLAKGTTGKDRHVGRAGESTRSSKTSASTSRRKLAGLIRAATTLRHGPDRISKLAKASSTQTQPSSSTSQSPIDPH